MSQENQTTAIDRRDFLRLSIGAAVMSSLGGLVACGSDLPLKIAVQPWCGYQFLFLAQQKGWLPADEVQLLETGTNLESIARLKEGRVDAAAMTLDELLRLRAEGVNLSAVLVFDISAGADALLVKPEIKTLADLKGRRIGVEDSALGSLMLTKTLEAAKLQQSEVNIVLMQENHADAWNRNHMDAILTYEPWLSQLESRSLLRLFDSHSLPQIIIDVLAVRTEIMQRHAAGLRSATAGHLRAVDLWHQNPIDAMYPLSARLGVKPEDVSKVFHGLDLPDHVYNHEYLAAPAKVMNKSAREIVQILMRTGRFKHAPSLDRLFVADYLPGDTE